MKSTSLAVAADECSEHLSKAQLPKLSYNKALSSWIRLPDGRLSQVWSCPAELFRAFILARIETHGKLATATKNEFNGLLGELDELARWFVLLELQQYRVSVDLFESEELARKEEAVAGV